MTARTRYFFVGAALVLVMGLGIGTVAYYGGVSGGLFAAGPGPDELKYVPRDAAVVAYANVQDVMRSELRQRLVKLHDAGEEDGRQQFQRETGIDIERDIDYVVAGMMAKEGEGNGPNALILARGRFDATRIEALAREHGGTVEQYKGKRILSAIGRKGHDAADGEARMALSFIEPGLAVMGDATLVRRAIDTGGKGTSVTDNAELMKLVGEMGSGSMWAVGRFDSLASRAKLPSEVSGRIPPISLFGASGHINGGIQAMLKAETQSEEAATNLRDIIRGFTALAKMSTGSKPELQALWPEIELGGTGKTVTLSFSVSSALLDALTQASEMHKKVLRNDKTEPTER